MRQDEAVRARLKNPFHELFVTELLEDAEKYRQMFSPMVLIGESLQLFRPANTVVIGPQGSGKSMLLNLLRYRVVSEWLSSRGALPRPIASADPYLGLSVNLVRVNFAAFGSRTISHARGLAPNPSLDADAAFDFLSHVLFREFVRALQLLADESGAPLREWTGLSDIIRDTRATASAIGQWPTWHGWYSTCSSLDDLMRRCDERISTWRSFANANLPDVPAEVWETKTTALEAMHALGNLLRESSSSRTGLPLFVTFDQYEVLPELNATFGTTLQRVVNSLIKARDPVTFYKIGARTYDWGRELRVWPGESRIEEQRDYRVLDLSHLLMKHESGKWIFPKVAIDVFKRRVRALAPGGPRADLDPEIIFGKWHPKDESWMYYDRSTRRKVPRLLSTPELRGLARGVPDELLAAAVRTCGKDVSPLDVRLACAWISQQIGRGRSARDIKRSLKTEPWLHNWWRKERVSVALTQVASFTFSRRFNYGWSTIVSLAGGNITALVFILGEIWDEALKDGLDPIEGSIAPRTQSDAIRRAADRWLMRDRNEVSRGSRRFEVIQRLGEQIYEYLVQDPAISNPGHSGFSVTESSLAEHQFVDAREFLLTAVHWAVLEERHHTSKEREGGGRRKFFLHPLLAPSFGIPHTRVKEPLYTTMEAVNSMIFEGGRIFRTRSAHAKHSTTASNVSPTIHGSTAAKRTKKPSAKSRG